VIPCFVDRTLWYLKVRRPVPPLPGPKYQQVKGGGKRALFGLNHLDGKRVAMICEGEFDALLLWQEAGDLVDVVALGSATARPSPRFLAHLLGASHWPVATDRDDAGEKSAAWWDDFSAGVRRVWPLQGKDLTDFYQAGGDLRAWVIYHLERVETEARPAASATAFSPQAIPFRAVTSCQNCRYGELSVSRPQEDPFQAEAGRLPARASAMEPEAWKRGWAALAKRAGWPCWGMGWDTWADPLLRRCVEELGAVVRIHRPFYQVAGGTLFPLTGRKERR